MSIVAMSIVAKSNQLMIRNSFFLYMKWRRAATPSTTINLSKYADASCLAAWTDLAKVQHCFDTGEPPQNDPIFEMRERQPSTSQSTIQLAAQPALPTLKEKDAHQSENIKRINAAWKCIDCTGRRYSNWPQQQREKIYLLLLGMKHSSTDNPIHLLNVDIIELVAKMLYKDFVEESEKPPDDVEGSSANTVLATHPTHPTHHIDIKYRWESRKYDLPTGICLREISWKKRDKDKCFTQHRENGPSCITYSHIEYKVNDMYHRGNDMPAYIVLCDKGDVGISYNVHDHALWEARCVWYQNGQIHRDDGNEKPAIVTAKGTRMWYMHNGLHRGYVKPAIIRRNNNNGWYVDGVRVARVQNN